MKQIASKLGLGHLALLFSGCMLFAGLQSGAGALYLAQQDQQASGSGATAIVQAALNIVYHISFTTLNPVKDKKGKNVFTHYSENDGKTNPYPGFDQAKLLPYWQQGGVNLFDVECAGFVSGVLDQANYPMVQPLGLAIDYWEHPGNSFPSSDWQYVLPLQGGETPPGGINPIKGLPLPGDIAVFSEAKDQPPGHVAVVVAVNPPANSQANGTIVLAQANFTPNYWTSDPGKSTWKGANPVSWITTPDIPLYVAPLTPMGNIDLSPRPLLGYIRNLKAQAASTVNIGASAKLPANKSAIMAEILPILAKYDVPPLLVETIIQEESAWNPQAPGDYRNGQPTSFGLFQLHIGGQADAAIRDGYTTTDLYDPLLNARYAMPAIAGAWDSLKGSFNAGDMSWWLSFAAKSGHPGGSPTSSVTIQEATALQKAYDSLLA